jgi:hypothetical protein
LAPLGFLQVQEPVGVDLLLYQLLALAVGDPLMVAHDMKVKVTHLNIVLNFVARKQYLVIWRSNL